MALLHFQIFMKNIINLSWFYMRSLMAYGTQQLINTIGEKLKNSEKFLAMQLTKKIR